MSGIRTITLGGRQYPLGQFSVGQVAKIAPLLKTGKAIWDSPADAQATCTVVHQGLCSGGYKGSFDDFQKLDGVTYGEMVEARLEIGKAIGYFAEQKDAAPGEGQGEESP